MPAPLSVVDPIGYYRGDTFSSISSGVAGIPQGAHTKPIQPNPINRLEEKVRAATLAGRVNFMPYLDPYTEETVQMRRMYPVMLRHPVVKQALGTKIESVAQLEMQMIPASDSPRDAEISEFMRYQYQDALDGEFQGLVQEILYPGLIYKSSVSELVWYDDLWQRGQHAGKRFLKTLKAKEFGQLVQDEFRNVVGVRALGFGQAVSFSPSDFAVFINFRLFHGAGMSDLRAAYYPLWELDTVSKLHCIHLEKYLTPVTVASYSPTFDLNNLSDLETDLGLIRSRSWLAVPDTVKIEMLQMATRGEGEFMEFCRDRREQIALSIAGAYLQMLTSGHGGGDIRGDSATQKATTELLVGALAGKVTSILNKQVTPRVVDENYHYADYPKVALGAVNYTEQKDAMEVAKGAQACGFPLSKKAFGRQFALQEAKDDGDVLKAASPAGPGQATTSGGPDDNFDFGDDGDDFGDDRGETRRSFRDAPRRRGG